ncbi:MAG: hypothetical protein M0P19_05525 [Nevskia sp.]|jgi:hypothetical protein|nr:hypothetical protein [Nevskia sp.]MCK9384906.1 hypothetical protein [Nevskia sp.]
MINSQSLRLRACVFLRPTVAAALLLTLSACGGGDGGAPPSPPTVSLAFSPATVLQGGNSILTVRIASAASTAATGVAFNLAFPAGLVSAGAVISTCGGTATSVEGSAAVTLNGGQVAATSNCSITLPVNSPTVGNYELTLAAGALTSSNGSNTNSAATRLSVEAAPVREALQPLVDGNLRLFDPTLPVSALNPALVDTGVGRSFPNPQYVTVFAGNLNAGQYSNIHPQFFAYLNGVLLPGGVLRNGVLRVVDLQGPQSQVPRAVSTARGVCAIRGVYTDSDPAHTWLSLEVAGGDNRCDTFNDNNTTTLVRLDMGASSEPLQITGLRSVIPIHSSAGAISGFFTLEGSTLMRRDAAFGSPETMIALNPDPGIFPLGPLGEIGGGRLYLTLLAVGDGHPTLYRYDVSSRVLTRLYEASAGVIGADAFNGTFPRDEQNLYFGEGAKLMRLALNGTTPEQVSEGAGPIYSIHLTANRIVFDYDGSDVNTGGVLRYVSSALKTATSASPTVLIQALQSDSLPTVVYTDPSGLVYIDSTANISTAMLFRDDGTSLATIPAGSYSVGIAASEVSLAARSAAPFDRLLLARDAGGSGATLDLVQSSTGEVARRVGTLVTNYQFVSAIGLGRYLHVQARVDRSGTGNGPFDVDSYTADSQIENLIQPVGVTSGTDEFLPLSVFCIITCTSIE